MKLFIEIISQGLQLFHESTCNQSTALHRYVPGNSATLFDNTIAPANDLFCSETRLTHSPGSSRKTEHMYLFAIYLSIISTTDSEQLRCVNFTGCIILIR